MHRGARVNRPVALVTEDFRQYHALAPFFAARGIELLGLAPADVVPDAVAVLLDGPANDGRTIPCRQTRAGTWVATLVALRGGYRRATIGIDPGDTVGVALLVDDQVFDVATAHEQAGVLRRMEAWAEGLGSFRVHVGNGAPRVGLPLMGAIRRRWPDAIVATVSEKDSTPTSAVTQNRHTDAAIYIALREP